MMKKTMLLMLVVVISLHGIHALAAERFSASAMPDAAMTDYFNRCGPGITGGDSTYSTRLPGNRVMWLFSDSFVGRVGPEGTRDNASSQFIQGNTLAVHDLGDHSLTTYLGRNKDGKHATVALPDYAGNPYVTAHCPPDTYTVPSALQAMFTPPQCPSDQHCYFWGNAMVVDNKQLHVFLQMMEHTGSDAFGFTWHNTAIASLPLKGFAAAVPAYSNVANNGVSYGGAVMKVFHEDERFIYIYGMRAEPAGSAICSGHCLHVARVPKGKLADGAEWRYWGRTSVSPVTYGWTDNASLTVPMAGVSGPASAPMTQDQLGISRHENCGPDLPACYVIIAHQYTGGFTHTIQAWYAARPEGPWHGPAFVYDTPESTQPGQLFTYNAKTHPEFTDENGLLVSYDVNGLAPFTDPLNPFITAASYRPRFIRVKLYWEDVKP